jgi:hypothetical protein
MKYAHPALNRQPKKCPRVPGEYEKAANKCNVILDGDAKAWEDWIFLFVEKGRLQVRLLWTVSSVTGDPLVPCFDLN